MWKFRMRLKRQKKTREDLNQRHKDFLQKREDLSRQISDLDKEIFRLESQKNSYEEEAPRSSSIICGKSMNSLIIVRWSLGMKI